MLVFGIELSAVAESDWVLLEKW